MASSLFHRIAHKTTVSLESVRAHLSLWDVNHVGVAPKVVGEPEIDNDGTLSIGDNFRMISSPAPSALVVHRGANLQIGDDVVIGGGTAVSAHRRILIGNKTQIGAGCIVDDAPPSEESGVNSETVNSEVGIVIGEQVRIDAEVVIVAGASIGNGAWIARGSVVRGAIPPGVCAAGNPAEVVETKRRETPSVITRSQVAERLELLVANVFAPAADGASLKILRQIPGWDSLSSLRLLMAIEEEFSVVLPGEVFAKARALDELARLIAQEMVVPAWAL